MDNRWNRTRIASVFSPFLNKVKSPTLYSQPEKVTSQNVIISSPVQPYFDQVEIASIRSFSDREGSEFFKKINAITPQISNMEPQYSNRKLVKQLQKDAINEDRQKSTQQLGGMPNFFKIFRQRRLINTFRTNLIRNAYATKLFSLTSQQLRHLSDNIFDGQKQILRISSFVAVLINWSDMFDTLQPQSFLVLLFDFLKIITMIYQFFEIPFVIAFNLRENFVVGVVITGLMILEIILKLNVSYIHRGSYNHYLRIMIIQKYFHTDLFSDVFTLLLLIIYYQANQNHYLVLDVFLAVFIFSQFLKKIQMIHDRIQEHFNLQGSVGDFLGLMEMVLNLIWIAHCIACIWHGAAIYNNSGETWLVANNIVHNNIWSRYNYSFYWAIMTMTTVGYGDINPQNDLERGIASVFMFTSGIILSYMLNSIGTVLMNLSKKKTVYRKTLNVINDYMITNKVKYDLQIRIRSYLQYIYQEQQSSDQTEVLSVIGQLNSSLQDELFFQIKGNYLKSCNVMTKFSDKLIRKLTYEMQELRCVPEEPIVQAFSQDDPSLYIIIKGQVAISHISSNRLPNGERILAYLEQGMTFGEQSFFTGMPNEENVYGVGFSKLYKISRSSFLNLIKDFPQDLEIYFFLRDQALYGGQLNQINIQCLSCQQPGHSIRNCRYLHYQPDQERVLKQMMYSQPHTRIFTQRLRRRSPSTLDNQFIYQEIANHFQKMFQGDYMKKVSIEEEEYSENFMQNYGDYMEEEMSPSHVFLQKDELRPRAKSNYKVHSTRQQSSPTIKVEVAEEDEVNQNQNQITLRNAKSQRHPSIASNTHQKPRHELNIDRMYLFKSYYPRYNYEQVIKRLNKQQQIQKGQIIRPAYLTLSPYTFNFNVARKAVKARYQRSDRYLPDDASSHRYTNDSPPIRKKNLASHLSRGNEMLTSRIYRG